MQNKNDILKSYFGFDSLKPEQAEIIDSVLSNKDTIGLLPTGFGKSICFSIPSLLMDGITIVITPLIALMADQVNNLKSKFIKAEYINSLQTEVEKEIIYNRIRNNKVKILFVAGERLLTKKFLEAIKDIEISMIVFDEAHTLLWSEDFRQALRRVPEFINSLKKRPVILALTATATSITVNKIKNLLNLSNPNLIIGDPDRKNIYYRVIKTTNKERELLSYLSRHKDKGLIYTVTIKTAEYLYYQLLELGYKVGLYHGALEPEEKKRIQEAYTRGSINLMIATNAFGMGIDIPDIRFVIEYDLPSSIEDFVQQTGRGSRDGKYAEGILLFDIRDIGTNEYFIEHITNDNISNKELNQIKLDRYQKLDKMIELALSSKCIHQLTSLYFGHNHNGKCMMCSNCKKK